MKKLTKNLILSKLDEWKEEYPEYAPKNIGRLETVSFETKQPIDSHHSNSILFHMTRWGNGEGYDVSIYNFNELTKTSTDKQFSFGESEIEGMLYCLKELNYFE